MESRNVMIICNQKMADELIAQDENFKQILCICPSLGEDLNDAVLAVDMCMWRMLITSGDVYFREEIAGVKEREDN